MSTQKTPINKVLIANRGEIAVRVIRTAKKLGIKTVAVYSEADANTPHVKLADQALCIGPAPVRDSYLKIENILAAAKTSGADAIHPGYGFLSENAAFAHACTEAGINFIGPPASAMNMMGNKRGGKIAMQKACVPVVPGYEGSDQTDEKMIAEAKRIGYPIMIKAAAGGGGRGMRLIESEAAMAEALRGARSEAKNAFGDDELILEKAIIQPHHVEIQVFGDKYGHVIYLGERDCSVQRRHQKVIEESPSPIIDDSTRRAMGQAAVNAAKACGYVGAGTCEFIVDQQKNFYFLEMNTRLQVEHPVTEMVTGLDLVEWQFRIAAGEPLPLKQEEVKLQGHAIEARLYAENPAKGFIPQTGRIVRWQPSTAGDIRVDAGVESGGEITPFYDPMIAKLIAYGPTRDAARQKLATALEETVLFGVNTNKMFLKRIVEHPVFAAGKASTAFIAEHLQGGKEKQQVEPWHWALAAAVLYAKAASPFWREPAYIGWRNASAVDALYKLSLKTGNHAWLSIRGPGRNGGKRLQIRLAIGATSLLEASVTEEISLELYCADGEYITFALADGIQRKVAYTIDGQTVYLNADNGNLTFLDETQAPPAKDGGVGSGILKAPLDGAVVAVKVAVGDKVSKGQILIVIEAMKMEHQIKADIDGKIKSLAVQPGQQVKTRTILAEIEA